MMELKGIEEGHPADADLPQPVAWQGKSGSRPGANRREKRGCHYYCRDWPFENCRVKDYILWFYFLYQKNLQTEHYGKTEQAYATCIPPYNDEKKQYVYSNYPKLVSKDTKELFLNDYKNHLCRCAEMPRQCSRCDDKCSQRDGREDRHDYKPSVPRGK